MRTTSATVRATHTARPDGRCPCQGESADLLAAAANSRIGSISPSIYETARLVASGAWLPGHRSRIDHLLTAQRADGCWGGPEAYALVPTLSATEALLGTVLAPPPRLPTVMLGRCLRAVDAGLAAARRQLMSLRAADLPDTPAIEVIVPFLVAKVRARLGELRSGEVPGLDAWRARVTLPLPRGLTDRTLRAVLAALSGPASAPLKVLHSLEVVGDLAPHVRGVPTHALGALGAVGASPAATAAWLGTPPSDRSGAATRYLRSVIAVHGGAVPSVIPIVNFERAWVVNSLAAAGIALDAPRSLAGRMTAALGARGVAGGVGLPPDADTTSATITALRRLGVSTRDGLLRQYDVGTHFCTWAGERTASPTTNAHVLTALATSDARRSAWRTSAIQRTAGWLCDRQHDDGFWSDKWHASPFYATACTVVGLRDAACGPQAYDGRVTARWAAVVDRAVAWVLANQRRDGSWGRWAGTAEETAYALQILLYRAEPHRRVRTAATRGYRFLLAGQDQESIPLWHDKDLYVPTHVVRAAVVGARHLAESMLSPASRHVRAAKESTNLTRPASVKPR